MPRKSKKEKQESSQRKIFRLTQERTGAFGYDSSTLKQTSEIPKQEHSFEEFDKEDAMITKYFKIDLRKSLTIVGIVFALEFLLYSATINNYLSRWIKF